MKRTNMRTIRLPQLIDAPEDEETDEANVRAYNYAVRTAAPTLDDYVISPFKKSLNQEALSEAEANVGTDENGLLKDRHTYETVIGSYRFEITSTPTPRSSYSAVLAGISLFLDTIISDSNSGVVREGVRRVTGTPYVYVDYVIDEATRLKEENTTVFNRQATTVKHHETGDSVPLDESIEGMDVYLDFERYSRTNNKNADEFHKARSLLARIAGFKKEFENQVKENYAIDIQEIDVPEAYDYELSDGTAVRYLFYKKTAPDHGKIFSGIIGKTTKNIAGSTGDLDILRELAFHDAYDYSRGGSGIIVRTEEDRGNRGAMRIIRTGTRRDNDERVYDVYYNAGRIYVSANSLMENIKLLNEHYTTEGLELKIDFFAAIPESLR
jgi:hypothetical protein